MQSYFIGILVVINLVVTAGFTTFQSINLISSLKENLSENPEIVQVLNKLETTFGKINRDHVKLANKAINNLKQKIGK
jgi:hypothetical protein